MLELLILATLSPLNTAPAAGQFQPCVWPNPCGKQEETVKTEEPVEVAQFQTCVWPNPCAVTSGKEETLI